MSTLQAGACSVCRLHHNNSRKPKHRKRALSFSFIFYIIQANDIFVCDHFSRTKIIFTVERMSVQQLVGRCTENGRLY